MSGKMPLDTLAQYFADLKALEANVRLTAADERKLYYKMTRGPKKGRSAARTRMIEANLPLAVWWAKREYQRAAGKCPNLELEDMVQEANVGLCCAIDRYDAAKGRVSTYVGFRIRQGLRRYVAEKTTVVRTPIGAYTTIAPVLEAENRYVADHGRIPTRTELAEILGWKLSHIDRAWSAVSARAGGAPIDSFDVDYLAGMARISYEGEGQDEIITPLSDADAELFDLTLQSIHELPERLRKALSLHGKGESLHLIGDQMGVSAERVRQLVAEARDLVIRAVWRLRREQSEAA